MAFYFNPRGPILITVFMYTFLKSCRYYSFISYILCLNITEIATVKRGPLRFLLYLPVYGFCIDMPEDGLSTGRDM